MTDSEAETPIFWPFDVKSWLTEKDSDAGKQWRQEEKGTIEDEMVGWHHQLNGHKFEQTPGNGNIKEAWNAAVRHESVTKESDMAKQLNNKQQQWY